MLSLVKVCNSLIFTSSHCVSTFFDREIIIIVSAFNHERNSFQIYSKINIRVVLVALEFWNNGDKIDRNETASVYYDRFAKYRKNTLKKTFPDHDNAQLMW